MAPPHFRPAGASHPDRRNLPPASSRGLVALMRIKSLPPVTRFMFWSTAPFLVATIVLLPVLAEPPGVTGWIAMGALESLMICVLLGLYDPDRFWWCWRIVGGLICAGYVAYLISTIVSGEWVGDGRRSSSTALNALLGLVAFGYPGFMYAAFGRLTWRRRFGDPN